MASILTAISSVVTSTITWVGQFASAITGNDLLLLFVCVGMVFLGLNAVRKLMRV